MPIKNKSFTLQASLGRIGSVSVWRILPIRSQSLRRWLTVPLFLLSRQEFIMLSTWWCNPLLYGYLQNITCSKSSSTRGNYNLSINISALSVKFEVVGDKKCYLILLKEQINYSTYGSRRNKFNLRSFISGFQ